MLYIQYLYSYSHFLKHLPPKGVHIKENIVDFHLLHCVNKDCNNVKLIYKDEYVKSCLYITIYILKKNSHIPFYIY